MVASSRKKTNAIKGLVDDQGLRHEDSTTMCSIVHNYLSNLFTLEVLEVDEVVLNAVK